MYMFPPKWNTEKVFYLRNEFENAQGKKRDSFLTPGYWWGGGVLIQKDFEIFLRCLFKGQRVQSS